MTNNWTFRRKVGAGLALIALLAVAMGALAVWALRSVVASKDTVITVNMPLLVEAQGLQVAIDKKVAAGRGYLLTRDDRFLEQMRVARQDFTASLEQLRRSMNADAGGRLLDAMERAENEHQTALTNVIALRRSDSPIDVVARAFDEQSLPKRDALEGHVRSFVDWEKGVVEEARKASSDAAALAVQLVVAIGLLVAALALVVALILSRTIAQQIGTAVGRVQSSSAELQASANQQATGAKEQATAMNEITTTISELLATSKQIAEGAQRVAHIAEETARSAKSGEGTVEKAHESITGIRRQVDLVVGHMLDLGKKSQQIGAVLDIVAELAEQTNILAINATIEAAGAGDAGRRFAIVADEIRKLADRVGGSTKEIRSLIDDVRGAVNTTVMATEGGSKAVDAGSRQFGEVASAFKQIAGLVSTTTEAAREIELSTKQQATAVEQVNVAISNVAQATRETEASSSETLQTAAELAGLSKVLLRLIEPQTTA